MKKSLFLLAVLISVVFLSCDLNADNKAVATKAALETPKGKYSYAFGTDFGKYISNTMKQIDVEMDYSIILQAIRDQMDTTRQALMNDSEFMAAMQELMAEVQRVRSIKNLETQNAFLEKNKGEDDVISTASGLQYIVLAEGGGPAAKEGDTVTVHYTGTLIDGMKFDSSIDKNQPLSVVLSDGQLIQGWIEMLRLMKKGSKVKTWIPSNLGYGEMGKPPFIAGNSLLIFEMELLDIKPAAK
jgi:FKBP-type peptidyl-prolyl cis-trans isomerase